MPQDVGDELGDGAAGQAPPPGQGRIPSPQHQEPGTEPGVIDDLQLLALLEEHDYVQRRVAQILGVSHATVNRRMRDLGLRRPKDLGVEELAHMARETDNDVDEMARLLKVSRQGLKLRLVALGLLDSSRS